MKSLFTFRLMLSHLLTIAMLAGVCFPDSLTKGFAKGKSARLTTGIVTLGTTNQPIAGANVLLKGSQASTVTDQKGAYSITVNADNAVLVFSFIGHKTQEVSVGNKSIVYVMLVENNEVVVTALGMGQKWIASWTNATQAWFDYRRTGLPALVTGYAAKRKALPLRFHHVRDELNLNKTNSGTAIENWN